MAEEVEVAKMLDTLSAKMEELTKALGQKKEKAEETVKENPLAYVAGAFAGGLIVGYLMARGKG
jgi:ElaB/YqjD/DUF883 family membrane-anchored ribosome-binding protein